MKHTARVVLMAVLLLSTRSFPADEPPATKPAAENRPSSGFIWASDPRTSAKAPLLPLPNDDKTVLTLQLPDDPKAQLYFRFCFGLSGNSPLLFVTDSFTFKDGVAELAYHPVPPDPTYARPTSYYSQGFALGRPVPGHYVLRVVDSGKVVLERKWAVVKKVGQADRPTTQPAPPPATQPAKELTLDLGNKVTMKLVLIPAGKFMMGSKLSYMGVCEVTISKPFYMGVYEVTQAQYEQIMGTNPSSFKGGKNPVEHMSWNDAVQFCKKLSAKTGKTVCLPTEAQWEYTCRAGSETCFCFGDDEKQLGDYAWHEDNSGGKTHPGGQKKPNDWGLYDMHGNVWEWCSDWYADSYANANKTDPTGPASGTGRVLRGGGWDYAPRLCRSAFRGGLMPDDRDNGLGFRVAVDLK